MKRNELLFIVLPLLILLAWIIVYEIKTGIILDKVIFPSVIYFLTASCICGTDRWWHYFFGMAGLLLIFILLAILLKSVTGKEMIGGGAIKLLAVVGSALGLRLGIETGVAFIIFIAIGLFISRTVFSTYYLPSSPFVMLSIISIHIKNYGFKFFIPMQ